MGKRLYPVPRRQYRLCNLAGNYFKSFHRGTLSFLETLNARLFVPVLSDWSLLRDYTPVRRDSHQLEPPPTPNQSCGDRNSLWILFDFLMETRVHFDIEESRIVPTAIKFVVISLLEWVKIKI